MTMDELIKKIVDDTLIKIEDYTASDRNFILHGIAVCLEHEADNCLYEEYGLLNKEYDE